MKRRDAIRMTDEEVRAFLAEPHKLEVATINPDGTPHLVAMYYVVLDGDLAFWTYRKSQKVMNLRRDPRLTCLVEDGRAYGELRGVSITGRAELVEEPEVVRAVGEALYPRYFQPLDEAARAGVAASAPKRLVVRVKAEKVISWDHRKLGGGY
jgi:PPOX class probable F420-dependent enzyme